MAVINLSTFFHRGAKQLGIFFDYNLEIKAYVKKISGIRWSATKKKFYLLDTPKNRAIVIRHLSTKYVIKTENFGLESVEEVTRVSEINSSILLGFKTYMKGKRYSESTIRVYSGFVVAFLNYWKGRPFSHLTIPALERFVEDLIVSRFYSISSHRQLISALKLFLYYQCGTEMSDLGGLRPKKSKKLPQVLSQKEIIDLLRCTRNLKHRAILGLLYSSGLRIGELLKLELRDMDIDRKQLFIRNAKGRKDRYVILSEGYLPLMVNYLETYRPQRFFVEGVKGKPYSASSIRKFLGRSCKAASIGKKVTPHTLRHSFATHLMENGTGIRHIQELLGHTRPETTMIYTHIAKKDLMSIQSPLDTILISLKKASKQEQNILLSRNLNR